MPVYCDLSGESRRARTRSPMSTEREWEEESARPACRGEPEPALTHREIGTLLGIGRARVFYHEQTALQKLRRLLRKSGVESPSQFECVPVPVDRGRNCQARAARTVSVHGSYSPHHGWLPITQIISLNVGSRDIVDIIRAFRFLKETNERAVRPSVFVSTPSGMKSPYRVEAVAETEGTLRVRCWPTARASRSVADLSNYPATAILESEFDKDDHGEFDVPILLCVMVSTRRERR